VLPLRLGTTEGQTLQPLGAFRGGGSPLKKTQLIGAGGKKKKKKKRGGVFLVTAILQGWNLTNHFVFGQVRANKKTRGGRFPPGRSARGDESWTGSIQRGGEKTKKGVGHGFTAG